MFSFLLQCCRCRRPDYRTFGPNNQNERMIYSISKSNIPTFPLAHYGMDANDDSDNDRKLYTAQEETSSIGFLPSEATRGVQKRYVINETQNYFIQRNSSTDAYRGTHNQDIRVLPGPTITTINMAAERISDDPNWEEVDPFGLQHNSKDHQSSSVEKFAARYIIDDSSLPPTQVNYEKHPDILVHPSDIRPKKKSSSRSNKRVTRKESLQSSDDDSTISEMSGHDSETIYKTIRVLTPKSPRELHAAMKSLPNEDEYGTADIDSIELYTKNLLQRI